MMDTKFVSVLGYNVFNDDLSKIDIQREYQSVINCSISPNGYGIATKDKEFDHALKNTTYLVLDGVYFALASIFLKGQNIRRNQGPDVFKHFIERADKEKMKVFFLGSSTSVLAKIKNRLAEEYPGIQMESYSPPYKPEFSDQDNQEMINKINEFEPNILFIGLTAPKQEKWSIKHQKSVNSNLLISVGNVFDWYAGTQKTIHPIFFKLRVGWLVRIFVRPEIFRRNIANQMIFFRHLALYVLRLKKQPATYL